jgi:hypothetical protein
MYYYANLLPVVALQRIAGRLSRGRNSSPQSRKQNYGTLLDALFWKICQLELPIFEANRVAGVTAFVRASKT